MARICPSPKTDNGSTKNPVRSAANMASNRVHPSAPWLMDSGTTHHLTNDLDNLAIHSEYTGPEEVALGNGSKLPISHVGHSSINVSHRKFNLRDILCVPNAIQNLLSVYSFCVSNRVSVEFFPDFFDIKDLVTREILHKGPSKGGLYPLSATTLNNIQAHAASLTTWHARLGHANFPTIRKAVESSLISSSMLPKSLCSACSMSKSHKLPFC